MTLRSRLKVGEATFSAEEHPCTRLALIILLCVSAMGIASCSANSFQADTVPTAFGRAYSIWQLPVSLYQLGFAGRYLIGQNSQGRILAYKEGDGLPAWTRPTPGNDVSVFIQNNDVFEVGDNGSVVRLNPATGRTMWISAPSAATYKRGPLVTLSVAHNLIAVGNDLLSLRSGAILQQFPLGANVEVAPSGLLIVQPSAAGTLSFDTLHSGKLHTEWTTHVSGMATVVGQLASGELVVKYGYRLVMVDPATHLMTQLQTRGAVFHCIGAALDEIIFRYRERVVGINSSGRTQFTVKLPSGDIAVLRGSVTEPVLWGFQPLPQGLQPWTAVAWTLRPMKRIGELELNLSQAAALGDDPNLAYDRSYAAVGSPAGTLYVFRLSAR